VLDVVEVTDNWDRWLSVAAGAEVPLEVADPEDEVGDDGGAGVDLDAEELVGVDSEAGVFECLLVSPSETRVSRTSPSRRFMCSRAT
jgi:hypothetical protein